MAEDNKTEKATPKKRRDERKKGNIFKSQDIITVVSLLGCFYGLRLLAPLIYEGARDFMTEIIGYVGTMDTVSNDRAGYVMERMLIAAAKTTVPLLLISVFVSVIATGVQTKFLFVGKNAAPKFSRINPIEGIKKLISLRSLVELLKNMIKITILFIIIYQFIIKKLTGMMRTMYMGIPAASSYLLSSIMDMILQVSLWFVVIAVFDFGYQWWDYERQMKMSKQEVKEEYKQLEGDPQVKGRIRDIQRQRARNRMMQAVPTADVIIRNPTHYAVALKYDIEKDSAPILVAKGQDHVALRIVDIAEQNHIQVVENKPLARGIYATTELNQEIPPEFYKLVADILVYVYTLNKKEI